MPTDDLRKAAWYVQREIDRLANPPLSANGAIVACGILD